MLAARPTYGFVVSNLSDVRVVIEEGIFERVDDFGDGVCDGEKIREIVQN